MILATVDSSSVQHPCEDKLTIGTTEKVIDHLKESLDEPEDLDGFDELP